MRLCSKTKIYVLCFKEKSMINISDVRFFLILFNPINCALELVISLISFLSQGCCLNPITPNPYNWMITNHD